MSLSKLPAPLIAQISSFLEFKDILNLLFTNKSINKVIKNYKLDRPKCHELRLDYDEKKNLTEAAIIFTEGDDLKDIEAYQKEDPDIFPNFVKILEKFTVVNSVVFSFMDLTNNDMDTLMMAKIKFKELWIIESNLRITKDLFLRLHKIFKKVGFRQTDINANEIAVDEVFIELLSFCGFDYEGEFGMFHHMEHLQYVSLTNQTIEAMRSDNMPKMFNIPMWITSFTLGAIKNIFEFISTQNTDDLLWNFGQIKNENSEDAEVFLQELQDHLYPLYFGISIEFRNFRTYYITRQGVSIDKFTIEFGVLKEAYDEESDEEYSEPEDEEVEYDQYDSTG